MNTSSLFQSDATRLAKRRERMVQDQLVARGIGDRRVLAVMSRVPREELVPLIGQHGWHDTPAS